MRGFSDLGNLTEAARISMIGNSAMREPDKVIGFVVDDNAKADRYIEALQKDFPTIKVKHRLPFQGAVLVQITITGGLDNADRL